MTLILPRLSPDNLDKCLIYKVMQKEYIPMGHNNPLLGKNNTFYRYDKEKKNKIKHRTNFKLEVSSHDCFN